jgi:DNA-directed RNA polymerase specialized sigma24 family protein
MSKGAVVSKRRSRKSSANLPAETLARARREAGLEEIPAEENAQISEEPVIVARRAESLPPVQRRKRRKEVDVSELSQAEIAERLANPTRTVSEEELRQQYTYVLADLRSMGLLAGGLFVLMIVVAQFLGR